MVFQLDTICALSTPQGIGAIGVIRVSGKDTFSIINKIFKGKDLSKVDSHTVHFGTIRDGETIVDEVLIAVFKTPKSFTKEDVAEISCHGSEYIIRYILKLLLQNGCRMANPGEFTQRAFINGQFDLVQAEAVADLIAADSEAAHRTALSQMRGGFSKKIAILREELIHFASLVELELDFGEEDVQFADRDDLKALIYKLQAQLRPLIDSFDEGNVIKEGVPVAIIGPPNAGKSTLLNTLLNEEKAIVTAIAGTTRDVIEDVMFIDGIKFRFIDTAGIRETEDLVESMGIERSKNALNSAQIAIMLYENDLGKKQLQQEFAEILEIKAVVWVRNKCDLTPQPPLLVGEGERDAPIDSPSFKEGVRGEVKSMYFKLPEQVLKNARSLRKKATSAEVYLWEILRNKQLNGLKFRRQHPVEEGFVLDFYCAAHKLGIELDGNVHLHQKEKDQEREIFFKEIYGVTILRFSNDEVFNNVGAVLEKIIEFTSPSSLLVGGGKPLSQRESNALPSYKEGAGGGEIAISAKENIGIENLKQVIVSQAKQNRQADTMLTNLRHYEHLVKANEALSEVLQGINLGITGDFLAQDIRLSLHHLGELTGTITTDDLLANIFSKFCIGK